MPGKLLINAYHGTFNRSKRPSLSGIEYFAVHYTAGVGSAKNNCIYFATGDRKSSADFFIDPDGAIWEYNNVLDGYYTWAVGDGGGRYGITNANSVNVEVVNAGGPFTTAQIAALSALYEHVCDILGRRLEVVRHYDASRKHCPLFYVNEPRWAVLKAAIEAGIIKEDDMLVSISIPEGTYPVFRAYSAKIDDHILTGSRAEYDLLPASYKREGVAFHAPDTGMVVYRLINPNTGQHHYTVDYEDEVKPLVKAGWVPEDITFSSAREGVPVYRVYNPNTGSHHYPTSVEERDMDVEAGWKDEGVAWLVVKE